MLWSVGSKMLYTSYIKKLKTCPFCDLRDDEILKQNKSAILFLSKAPYTKDHLLVIPKKHVVKLSSLTEKNREEINKMIFYGLEKLKKKHKNIVILYREGNKKKVGKSIGHLHYHILPDMLINVCDVDARKRKIYSEEKYLKKVKDFKKKIK